MEKTPAVDCNEAVKKQALPTSAALGLAPWDLMHVREGRCRCGGCGCSCRMWLRMDVAVACGWEKVDRGTVFAGVVWRGVGWGGDGVRWGDDDEGAERAQVACLGPGL